MEKKSQNWLLEVTANNQCAKDFVVKGPTSFLHLRNVCANKNQFVPISVLISFGGRGGPSFIFDIQDQKVHACYLGNISQLGPCLSFSPRAFVSHILSFAPLALCQLPISDPRPRTPCVRPWQVHEGLLWNWHLSLNSLLTVGKVRELCKLSKFSNLPESDKNLKGKTIWDVG